jgi:hypothetical protein
MKILLDECMPKDLKKFLKVSGYSLTFTVRDINLVGYSNGMLLDKCDEKGIDVLITVDRGINHQQIFENRRVALIQFVEPASNAFDDLQPFLSNLLKILSECQQGGLIYNIEADPLYDVDL